MTTSGLVGKPGHLKAQCLCIPGSDVLKLSVTACRVAARRRPSHHHLRSAWTSVAAPDGTLGLWTARLAVRVPDVCVGLFTRRGSCRSPDGTCSKQVEAESETPGCLS